MWACKRELTETVRYWWLRGCLPLLYRRERYCMFAFVRTRVGASIFRGRLEKMCDYQRTFISVQRSRLTNCRNRPNIWQTIKSPFYIISVVCIWKKNTLKLDVCAFIISFRSFSDAKSTAENTYHDRVWLFLAVFVCSSTQIMHAHRRRQSLKLHMFFKITVLLYKLKNIIVDGYAGVNFFQSITGRARSLWHHWQRV